jgi:hypothetical protein
MWILFSQPLDSSSNWLYQRKQTFPSIRFLSTSFSNVMLLFQATSLLNIIRPDTQACQKILTHWHCLLFYVSFFILSFARHTCRVHRCIYLTITHPMCATPTHVKGTSMFIALFACYILNCQYVRHGLFPIPLHIGVGSELALTLSIAPFFVFHRFTFLFDGSCLSMRHSIAFVCASRLARPFFTQEQSAQALGTAGATVRRCGGWWFYIASRWGAAGMGMVDGQT